MVQASGYTCPICMGCIMMNEAWVTRPNGKRIHTTCGLENDEVRQCGWCGNPLTHKDNEQTQAETCEQAYGSPCSTALDHQSQLQYEAEQQQQEDMEGYLAMIREGIDGSLY